MTLSKVSIFLRESDEDVRFEYNTSDDAYWLNLRCDGIGDNSIVFFLPPNADMRLKVLRRMRESLDQAIQAQESVVHG